MSKTLKLYGALFIVLLALWVVFQVNKTEVTNWSKNFNIREKTPFGLYIFDQEAPKLLGNKLLTVNQNPFDYYREQTKKPVHNILVVQNKIDKSSWEKILEQVDKGSDAMVISQSLPQTVSEKI